MLQMLENKRSRHLLEQEKVRVLAAWDQYRQDFPNDGAYGHPDPSMNPWCDAINALPGVCTVQSCSGHRRDIGSLSSGGLWLRLDEPASNRFDSLAFELARKPGIERVYRLYSSWGEEIADISFQGEEYGCLNETMETVMEFLRKITSCSSRPYPWTDIHYPTRHSSV